MPAKIHLTKSILLGIPSVSSTSSYIESSSLAINSFTLRNVFTLIPDLARLSYLKSMILLYISISASISLLSSLTKSLYSNFISPPNIPFFFVRKSIKLPVSMIDTALMSCSVHSYFSASIIIRAYLTDTGILIILIPSLVTLLFSIAPSILRVSIESVKDSIEG